MRATLTAPVPDITVYFRSFDLDDPSTNSSSIDPNGSSPNDNRGTPNNGVLSVPSTSTSGILQVFSDSTGVAEVDFQVTMHPGDNFAVAVTVRGAVISAVAVGASGTSLVDGGGNPLPTVRARATDMLTVWRRLHIEVDSMGAVADNQVSGQVVATVANPLLDRSDVVVNTELELRRFDGGVFRITGIGDFPVLVNGTSTVGVQGLVPESAVGLPFTLVDDDDFDSQDGANKDGDRDEDVVSLPSTFSRMLDSDDFEQNRFTPAYIRPTYDGGGQIENDTGDVEFVLNVPQGVAASETQITKGQNSGVAEADDFWVVYVQASYQGRPDADEDGVDASGMPEGASGGTTVSYGTAHVATSTATVPQGGLGSLLYLETMRDHGLLFPEIVAPHEVGHQMGLAEGAPPGVASPGIMSGDGTTFVDHHINLMRWRVKSPGQP